MAITRKSPFTRALTRKTLAAVVLSVIALGSYPCLAQESISDQNIASVESSSHTLGATMYSAAHDPAALGSAPAPADTTSSADDQWHLGFAPYLWFAGMHGYAGAYGLNAGVKASPGDLLSHADVGLMGTLEARKEHWVIPVDFMWLALSDDRGLPENEYGVESITFRAGQFILTPKLGYQIIDTPKLKVDSTVGLRYWHLGERFHFNPILYNGFTTSQNWVDGVAGGRIELVLSPKASITVLGDAGGGQASQDYQVAGLLNFKVKKNITLFGGWRYLDVDYRNNSNLFLYNMTVSGVGLGAAFWFK
jgi:hypothetical protein